MQSSNLLILGGTGFVGTSVCEKLVERASSDAALGVSRILVPTRRAAHGQRIRSLPMVEVVEANIHDDKDLNDLVGPCGAVVNLVAQLHGSDAALQRPHVELPRRVAEACARSGLSRLIHVSALGLDAQPLPSRYLRTKALGEQALREAHGLRTTVLRPSVIFGARDRSTNLFATLQRMAPFIPLACANAQLQPVWVEDVAEAVVRCLAMPNTAGRIFECAGPQVLSLEALVRTCGRIAGVERPIWPLPAALGRLQAMVMEWLPGDPLISRDNLDSLSVPSVAGKVLPGLSALGIQPASLAQVAPSYLQARTGTARLDALRATARRG